MNKILENQVTAMFAVVKVAVEEELPNADKETIEAILKKCFENALKYEEKQ